MISKKGRKWRMIEGGAALCLLLLLSSFVLATGNDASAGTTQGVILDQAQYRLPAVLDSSTISGQIIRNIPFVGAPISLAQDTLSAQFGNKEQGANQNIPLETAKNDELASAARVAQMFALIAGTFIIVTDAILSIFYLTIFFSVTWIIFIGYIKFMVIIINFIYGRYKKYKAKP